MNMQGVKNSTVEEGGVNQPDEEETKKVSKGDG
jgi:hypothetical protein